MDLARQQLTECFDQCLLGLRNEFIRTVRSELAARKLNKNMIYYDDLLLLLDRALCGRGADSLAAIVREKFKAALIDEFQDTDAIQYAIFEKIFGGGKSTLFLIGDPKQAIYAFRGADIFTYMDAARRAALRFTLTENWRSEPGLTEAVNTVFAHPCLPFVYPEIGFKPAQPAAKKQHEAFQVAGGKEPPLQIWLVDTERISEGKPITTTNAREVIPGAVAGEISRLLMLARNGRTVIGDRPLREGDIAVLVRRNAEAQLVRQALAELGIHSVLYNIGHLFDTPEAMEVERILTSIADPSDERFLKIALATEMLGATGEMLDHLTRDEAAWEEWLVRFGEYHDLWNRNGFFRMFRHLLSREAVLPRLMSLLDGERRCTNILHLSEVLHQASVENNLNMFGLVKWLAAQRDSGTPRLDEHQLRLESDENAVKLVTIHKSKGLEYPVVFCPFIGDGSRLSRRDEPITFHDEANEMRLTLDLGSSRRDESAKLAEKEQLAENLRLLYVAMTRAKHRCYLVWGRFKDAETSAPAYLFHQPRSGEQERLPDAVAARFSTLDDEGLRIDLREVQAGTNGLIDVRDMPLERGTVLLPPEAETFALECRPFSGSIPRDWGIASFSSVIGSQSRTPESTDRDDAPAPATTIEEHLAEPLPAGLVAPDLHHLEGQSQELRTPPLPPFEEGRVGGFNVDMFDFPKGAPAGIFLHELFENLDFTLQDKEAITELIEDKLKAHGFESFWTSAIYDMIKKVLEVPLDSLDGTFSLSQVPKVDRLSELGFYFPLRRLSDRRLRDVFSCCLKDRSKGFSGPSTGTPQSPEPPPNPTPPFSKGGRGGFQLLPSSMGRLNFKPLEGFMRGFIDLVFRFRERFYIVDWKSNFLGGRTEDYRQASLQKAMEEGFYHLQYHLYTVAVHKYLETRVPAYRYESHFGGVFYLFLRGIDPAKGGDYGVYRHRPPAADIEALCSTLIGPVAR